MTKGTKAVRAGMINNEGQCVDLYIPRKCSATNQLIHANDHAAVQLNIGQIDENGGYTGKNHVYCFSGFIRDRAGSDQALNRLALRDRILREA